MKKLLTSILSFAIVCLMLTPFAGIKLSASAATANDYEAKGDEFYTYVQDFTDVTAVNADFNAFYRENALGGAQMEQVGTDPTATDTHWCVDGGVLKRINGVDKNADTNRIAILTFSKEAYANFEMSVDYKAGPTGFWPVIGIRQLEEGKYHLDDGAGVFLQSSGMMTLWGDPAVGGPHEFSAVPGYNATAWHNMQIRVLGNLLSVSVDNQPWKSQALPSEFYDIGYVSLISVNNETEYKNFRIKPLIEPEKEPVKNFAPVVEANSDDALSNLAGEVKDKDELFEREGKVNPDFVQNGQSPTGDEGCGSSLPCALGGVAALAVVGLAKKNRKGKK